MFIGHFCLPAQAFEKLCFPGESGYTENNAGSQGAWCDGSKTKDYADYSESQNTQIRRRTLGVAEEGGTSTDTPTALAGETASDTTADGTVVTRLRGFGQSIGTDVSDAWANFMSAEGFVPSPSTLLKGVGDIGLATGAFALGYKIGGVIDGWLGIGGSVESKAEGYAEVGVGSICQGSCLDAVKEGDEVELSYGAEGPCGEDALSPCGFSGPRRAYVHAPPGAIFVWDHSPNFGNDLKQWTMVGNAFAFQPGGLVRRGECAFEGSPSEIHTIFWPNNPYAGGIHVAFPEPLHFDWECFHPGGYYTELGVPLELYAVFLENIYGGDGVNMDGFPGGSANGVSAPEHVLSNLTERSREELPTKHTVPPELPHFKAGVVKIPQPSPPGGPEIEIPAPGIAKIPREVIPTVPGTKAPPSEEEEKALIEILTPEENELATHYKTRLETAGFIDVVINTLPEVSIDPEIGPSDVSKVNPSPGEKVAPTTKIIVDANPSDAPTPGEPPASSKGPVLPGFKFPHFGVLCKGFPLGVPCWLAKTVESWSATPEAPNWGFENLEVHGKRITGKFSLSHLEPLMEVLRPVMLAFATIGLVLLFYNFARGGAPASGAGIEDPNPNKYGELGGGAEETEFR